MMKEIHAGFVFLLIVISVVILAVLALGVGAVMTVGVMISPFLTYYPAVMIDWVVGKVRKQFKKG